MAKVKELKKNIEELAWVVIDSCDLALLRSPEIGEEKVESIVEAASKMYEDFIRRANHVDGKNNPKLVKEHFRKLNTDLEATYIALMEQVKALSK